MIPFIKIVTMLILYNNNENFLKIRTVSIDGEGGFILFTYVKTEKF